MRSRLPVIGISLAVALLTLIPYGLAYAYAGEYRFTGFLFNPYDAASYLAKMRQGYDGQLLYTLAFTEDPGPGAPIFLYYVFLGRLARMLQMPLIVLWHAARSLGGAFFLIVAWEFFGRIGVSPRARIVAWILAALGSGLGFTAVLFGTFTADLWVAEYIPFLGILTNAHFPLATGLILLLAMLIALPARRQSLASGTAAFLCGTLLGIIQPFAFLPLMAALTVWMIWIRASTDGFPEGSLAGMLAAGLGFLPWAACYFWITQTLPKFTAWFAQNQTPTPPVWDIALSAGVPGIIALISFIGWLRVKVPWREKLRSIDAKTLLLGLWLVINFVLLFAPFSLQRRLMLGMWIPLSALAAPKIESWIFRSAFSIRRALAAGIPLFLTNAVFLAAILSAGMTRNPSLFLGRDESAAVDWLNAHARGSVVLASPGISMWLPGMAGARVVFGHPMETPDAEQALQDTEAFFNNNSDPETRTRILLDRQVDWVLGATDQQACTSSEGGLLVEVFSSGKIKIFAVR